MIKKINNFIYSQLIFETFSVVNFKFPDGSKIKKQELFEELFSIFTEQKIFSKINNSKEILNFDFFSNLFKEILVNDISLLNLTSFTKLFHIGVIILKKNLLLSLTYDDIKEIISYQKKFFFKFLSETKAINDIFEYFISNIPSKNIELVLLRKSILNLFIYKNNLLYSLYELKIQDSSGNFMIDHPKYMRDPNFELGQIQYYEKNNKLSNDYILNEEDKKPVLSKKFNHSKEIWFLQNEFLPLHNLADKNEKKKQSIIKNDIYLKNEMNDLKKISKINISLQDENILHNQEKLVINSKEVEDIRADNINIQITDKKLKIEKKFGKEEIINNNDEHDEIMDDMLDF